MADIDTVLERLITDASFRQRLEEDPAAALSAYDLSAADLQLLASSLDSGDAGQRGVEQRTSKSAVIGLLASLTGGGGSSAGKAGDIPVKNQNPIGVDATRLVGSGKGGSAVGPDPTAAPGDQISGSGSSKYTAPINVAKPTEIRTGPAQPPGLDGASKDTASLSQHAPPDDTLHKLPGKPKPGEITVTKSAAAPPDDARHKVPGLIKWNRSGSGSELPPAGSGDAGTEDFHTIKLTNATVKDSARLSPPSGDAGAEDFHTIKLTNAGQQSADHLAPSGSGDGGITDFKVTNQGGMPTGTLSPPAGDDDYLRIEDE